MNTSMLPAMHTSSFLMYIKNIIVPSPNAFGEIDINTTQAYIELAAAK